MASAGERLALAADAVWGRYGPPPGAGAPAMGELRGAPAGELSAASLWLQTAQFLRRLTITGEAAGANWPAACFDAAWEESGSPGGRPVDYLVFLFGISALHPMAYFQGPPTDANAVRAHIGRTRGFLEGRIDDFGFVDDTTLDCLDFMGLHPYVDATDGYLFGPAPGPSQAQVIPV